MQAQAYRATPGPLAAQNFTMPAMSPTMTEGNIASWKVTEGWGYSSIPVAWIGHG